MKKQPTRHDKKIKKLTVTGGGMIIGFISTLVGIGGGTMTVPFLHWFNISMRNAVATSAACGFPIALIGTLSFIVSSYGQQVGSTYSTGYLQYDAFLFVAGSSFVTAPLGAKVAHSVSEKTLRLSFATLLYILATIMIFR